MHTPDPLSRDSSDGYAEIRVQGPDARDFLQGQLSNDLRSLADASEVQLAAWCNPKGRVIALLRVAGDAAEGHYRLALPAELAETVVRRLGLFRFRAKVDFDTAPADPGMLGFGDDASFGDWQRDNLRNGIAEILPVNSEQYTPHMLNLDKAGALSFDKGCYTGQEIVARTHYRGASKRRMLRFSTNGHVPVGTEVVTAERKAGHVVNSIGKELLAVVSLAQAEDALTAGGRALVREPLPYAL